MHYQSLPSSQCESEIREMHWNAKVGWIPTKWLQGGPRKGLCCQAMSLDCTTQCLQWATTRSCHRRLNSCLMLCATKPPRHIGKAWKSMGKPWKTWSYWYCYMAINCSSNLQDDNIARTCSNNIPRLGLRPHGTSITRLYPKKDITMRWHDSQW